MKLKKSHDIHHQLGIKVSLFWMVIIVTLYIKSLIDLYKKEIDIKEKVENQMVYKDSELTTIKNTIILKKKQIYSYFELELGNFCSNGIEHIYSLPKCRVSGNYLYMDPNKGELVSSKSYPPKDGIVEGVVIGGKDENTRTKVQLIKMPDEQHPPLVTQCNILNTWIIYMSMVLLAITGILLKFTDQDVVLDYFVAEIPVSIPLITILAVQLRQLYLPKYVKRYSKVMPVYSSIDYIVSDKTGTLTKKEYDFIVRTFDTTGNLIDGSYTEMFTKLSCGENVTMLVDGKELPVPIDEDERLQLLHLLQIHENPIYQTNSKYYPYTTLDKYSLVCINDTEYYQSNLETMINKGNQWNWDPLIIDRLKTQILFDEDNGYRVIPIYNQLQVFGYVAPRQCPTDGTVRLYNKCLKDEIGFTIVTGDAGLTTKGFVTNLLNRVGLDHTITMDFMESSASHVILPADKVVETINSNYTELVKLIEDKRLFAIYRCSPKDKGVITKFMNSFINIIAIGDQINDKLMIEAVSTKGTSIGVRLESGYGGMADIAHMAVDHVDEDILSIIQVTTKSYDTFISWWIFKIVTWIIFSIIVYNNSYPMIAPLIGLPANLLLIALIYGLTNIWMYRIFFMVWSIVPLYIGIYGLPISLAILNISRHLCLL
jgi:hypothetical protein